MSDTGRHTGKSETALTTHSSMHVSPNLMGNRMTSPTEESQEIPLREYLGVIVKYRFVIGICIAISTVLAIIYSLTATPYYVAKSKIRISSYEPVLSATKIEDMLEQKSKEGTYLETQLEELKSFSLADRVLEDKQIYEFFKGKDSDATVAALHNAQLPGGYKAPVAFIKAYLGGIDIKPVRRTSLVWIEATSRDPNMAARIANQHALSYIDWVRNVRVEQQSRALKYLRGQAEELREKVADLEREMADYAEANSIVAVNKDENIVAQKMAQLNQLLTDIITKRIEAENLYKEADVSLDSEVAAFDDVSIQQMRSELAKFEAEYQQLSVKFMPTYPRMVQIKAQIEGLRSSIKLQREQIVKGLKTKASALLEQEKNMKEELEQQKSRAFELSKKQVQYNILNREVTSSRELLENVLKQIKETSLSVESNSSNVSVVDVPIVPSSPSYPSKRKMVLMGMLIGLAIGFALSFLLNYLDSSIRTADEITTYLRLPSLGVVPSFGLERIALDQQTKNPESTQSIKGGASDVDNPNLPFRQEDSNLPILFIQNPRSHAAEAYRTIRTGLLLSQAGEPPRKILVTSAQSGEGKTTSAVNLAVSLASSGGRVVLIDADLRRPSMFKHFGLTPEMPGLVELLTGHRNFDEVAVRDLVKRVTVILSGHLPPNPAELLGSLEMQGLIDRLATEYDYVIIDCPPVLPVTDSVVLSRFVDGVMLVVRAAVTPRKIAQDARDRLKAVGAHMLGTILNDLNFVKSGYYYYNKHYRSYYQSDGYGQDISSSSSRSDRSNTST